MQNAGRGLATRSKQFTDVTTIVKDQSLNAKLQGYIDETIRCQTKILDEKKSIKDIKDAAVEDLGIDPKMFTRIVDMFFNNSFEQKLDELSRLETAIHALMQVNSGLTYSGTKDKLDNE